MPRPRPTQPIERPPLTTESTAKAPPQPESQPSADQKKPAPPPPSSIIGAGKSPCYLWLTAISDRTVMLELSSWLDGYLSGHTEQTSPEISATVTNYCQDHINDAIYLAANSLRDNATVPP